ncbi:protein moonraker isoform 2-T2 [Anomaloglossus baeobatrachus]
MEPHRGTQLRFNLDVLTNPTNLAAQYTNPSPIVIEKLSTPQNRYTDHLAAVNLLQNSRSPVLSVVSEERLNLAVQLAKRDVKRKHLRHKVVSKEQTHPKSNGLSDSTDMGQRKRASREAEGNSSLHPEVTRSGARVYVYTPDRSKMDTGVSDSPPTQDPGPGEGPIKGMDPSEHEVKRLQKDLHSYMQKIEELAKKERHRDLLDPLEEVRGRIRQQERAARSARMLYVLQQQVKEIQEDLEKLSPQKIKHAKKTRAMSRLAAVHRGAIRALQMFIAQMNERGEQQIPSFYKELGHIIRQLSLCTAKLETGGDPAASSLIISILQRVEDLDVLLEAKISSDARKPLSDAAANKTPPVLKVSRNAASPDREARYPQPVHKEIKPWEESRSHVNRRLVVDDPHEVMHSAEQTEPDLPLQPSTPERRSALKSGLEALIQSGRLNGLHRSTTGQNKSKGVLIPQRPKGFRQPRKIDPSQRSHFQEKTVSFKLKENRPVPTDKKIPWVPPNPTSPSTSPKRLDWLESETAKRLQQLDNLYREEIAHLRDLRKEAHAAKSPPYAHRTGSNVTGHQLEEDLSSATEKDESLQLVNRTEYSPSPQQPDELEAIFQKMEEMEKYQEVVRQRFTQIVYSDPEFWAQEEKDRSNSVVVQRPHSPHPIRITKPVGQRETVVDIILEEPYEGDSLQIHKEELARRSPHLSVQHPIQGTKGFLSLSVPTQMLKSIHNYTQNFDRHLHLTSHEEVGDFNPWHITDSLAEELLDDAVGEVAAELHDLCGGYAEAVFTSEFMEPTENN